MRELHLLRTLAATVFPWQEGDACPAPTIAVGVERVKLWVKQ
jgi:hypothetical protein